MEHYSNLIEGERELERDEYEDTDNTLDRMYYGLYQRVIAMKKALYEKEVELKALDEIRKRRGHGN